MSEPLIPLSPRQVPAELLARYQANAPRYTSYPTAPQFVPSLDEAEAARRWKASNTSSPRELSLYIHIPFCRVRCLYCGCHTRVGCSDSLVDGYIAAVLQHLDASLELVDSSRPVEQLSLGGGTPSYLTLSQMTGLLRSLRDRLSFTSRGERAIELDPRTADADYIDLLLDLGFNRISFGVQDLDVSVQEAVRRILPVERIASLMSHLGSRGMKAVNLDLIYGLPRQTPESFGRTVEQIIALAPSRIALFGYAHVPWVSPHQKELEPFPMPGPAERMEIFGQAYERLVAAGYLHVGMDHFAREDDELIQALRTRTLSRNFMGYTTRRGLDLVALGASGISSVGGTYAQNEKDIDRYVQGTGMRWTRGFLLSEEDRLRREVILDLFCNFHLDLRDVERRFGIVFRSHFARELSALQSFIEDGLVELREDSLSVTDLGRFFVRNVAMVFDQYMRGGEGEPRYSKVI